MDKEEKKVFIVITAGSYGQHKENGEVELKEKGDVVKVDKEEALRLLNLKVARMATSEDV